MLQRRDVVSTLLPGCGRWCYRPIMRSYEGCTYVNCTMSLSGGIEKKGKGRARMWEMRKRRRLSRTLAGCLTGFTEDDCAIAGQSKASASHHLAHRAVPSIMHRSPIIQNIVFYTLNSVWICRVILILFKYQACAQKYRYRTSKNAGTLAYGWTRRASYRTFRSWRSPAGRRLLVEHCARKFNADRRPRSR